MTETRRLRARIADEIQQRGRKHASGEPLYFDRANLEAAIDAALLSEPQAAQRPVFGTWPEHCEQRAFVEGAKWWLWRGGSCTMFPTEVDEAEEEAIERYGAPPVLPAPPEQDWMRDMPCGPHGRVHCELCQPTTAAAPPEADKGGETDE